MSNNRLKQYKADILNNLEHFQYQLIHGNVTLDDLDETCRTLLKVIIHFKNSKQSEPKKRNRIIRYLKYLTNLIRIGVTETQSKQLQIFEQIHSDIKIAHRCTHEYLEECRSLKKDLYAYLELYVFETKQILNKLERSLIACKTFSEAHDELISHRNQFKELITLLGEMPLGSYTHYINQEIADLREGLFDQNINLLLQWNERMNFYAFLDSYCSNHEVLGNTHH